MDERAPKSERRRGFELLGAMVAVMWVTEVVDAVLSTDLDEFGIRPRELDGLDGILFAPFLHAGFGHLIANTIPFLLLGGLIALSGLARVAAVTAIVALVTGLGTWLTGSENSLHIGASGVVFGFGAYLIARFAYSRNAMHLAIGIAVVLVWGVSLLWGLVPREGISWSGHAFGAVGGVLAARLLERRRLPQRDRRAALHA